MFADRIRMSAPRVMPRVAEVRPDRQGVRAFTLVEMIVVVAVIVILLGIILPAASSLWNQRKGADAQNTVSGLLMAARARAMQGGGTQTGLFFFIDRQGAQRIATIEQAAASDPAVPDELEVLLLQNVFRITGERDQVLPVPMRVVPRYAAEPATPVKAWETFTDAELARQDIDASMPPANAAQRHRNFFSMVYSSNGQLVIWRDVLLQEADENMDGMGDRTGLHVGADLTNPNVVKYYVVNPITGMPAVEEIDPTDGTTPVPYLVTDPTDAALNFPSVDGLLVYDDALFAGLSPDTAQMRDFLVRSAQPFYVNRNTGAVILGPSGENVVP